MNDEKEGREDPGIRTILGWFKPFNTSISPNTLASFPFTFFLGITFIATSFWRTVERREGEGDLEEDFDPCDEEDVGTERASDRDATAP